MMTDEKQPPSRIEQSLHIADVSIESDIGLTEVEKLAHGIERMRENRLVVPFAVRKRLLNECQKVARATNNKGRIPLENLIVLRDKAQEEVEAQTATLLRRAGHAIGFFNESKLYLDVLERAVQRVAEELDSDFFYYQDFAFYFTRQISRWPWFRSSFITYLLVVLSYYLFTPILFCVFLRDEQVCPTEKAYGGWLTALYFASTTLSTVGYGDVSVIGDGGVSEWRILVGALYMILSGVVLVTAFSSSIGVAPNPVDHLQDIGIKWLDGKAPADQLLYQRIRNVKFVKITIIVTEFAALNLLGMFAARFFVNASEVEAEQWSWMTTFYWSVQTTTTIGYGDLDMPFHLRWFQIFYLVIATYFVGDSLGRIGSLSQDISEIRREYAWSRREVSKGLVRDMQAGNQQDEINEYEFIVASLLSLNKIDSDDITAIMKKFKSLSKGKSFISLDLDDLNTSRLSGSDTENETETERNDAILQDNA